MATVKSSRRIALDKDKAALFIIVSVGAVIVVASLVFSKSLWSQGNYLSRVVDKKEKALEQLKRNKDAADSLKASYDTFTSQDPNLIGGSKAGKSERDGDNAKLILDALPSKYDFPATVTSFKRLVEGFDQGSFSVSDQSTAITSEGITEIPFSMNISTSYAGLNDFIGMLDRCIRPIHITNLSLNGTSSTMTVTVTAKTYYQPGSSLQITKGEVK